MAIKLYDFQKDAVRKMRNGCILCGGVGSGKSITSLAYYHLLHGGKLDPYEPIDDTDARDLYVITTAKKRDSKEWEKEMIPFLLSTNKEECIGGINVVVDSWNNIKRYVDVKDAFFIFDEQKVSGKGAWSKTFVKIAKANKWILLSATPGDTWSDYIPVFVANGFYKNPTQFHREHSVWVHHGNFYKIDRYVDTRRLIRYRSRILIDMDFKRPTESHHINVTTEYDKQLYKDVLRNRWSIETHEPLQNAGSLCLELRKIVNSDQSRVDEMLRIAKEKRKVIVFYNFDYELYMLKDAFEKEGILVAEWNGHKHQPVPDGTDWVYLVNYLSGSEGWNCIKTDTIVFFSQNYSYKAVIQAAGRIDRLNTPYKDLYFYHLKSKASIDIAIERALKRKKDFNAQKFISNN